MFRAFQGVHYVHVDRELGVDRWNCAYHPRDFRQHPEGDRCGACSSNYCDFDCTHYSGTVYAGEPPFGIMLGICPGVIFLALTILIFVV